MLEFIADNRKIISVTLAVVLFFTPVIAALADSDLTCDYLMELGKKSLLDGRYDDALRYFHLAEENNSEKSEEVFYYTHLIKRMRDGRVTDVKSFLDRGEHSRVLKNKVIGNTLDVLEKKLKSNEPEMTRMGEPEEIPAEAEKDDAEGGGEIDDSGDGQAVKPITSLMLTDELWQKEPKTVVGIDINKPLTIDGKNIKRFLMIDPTIAEATRVTPDKINVAALRAGTTFLHLWDDRGRWTLPIKVLLYSVSVKAAGKPQKDKKDELEIRAEPFRVNYTANIATRYDGNMFQSLQFRNLDIQQAASLWGSTPYGDLDFTTDMRQFRKAVSVNNYTAGLTNCNIGPFKHYNVRWGNIGPPFSQFVGGTGLRGVLLNDKLHNDKVEYTLYWGRDTGSYGGTLSAGISGANKNYLEGAKISILPFDQQRFDLNVVNGYGQRSGDLPRRVFSLAADNMFGNVKTDSEIGFDGKKFALLFSSRFPVKSLNLRSQFRHINLKYSAINGPVSGRGISEGRLGMSTSLYAMNFSTDFTVKRDRLDFNPGKPRALNLDSTTSLGIPFGKNSSWQTNIFWAANPGNSFPQHQLRINNIYARAFKFMGRDIAVSLGENFQRLRYILSPASDYNQNDYPVVVNVPFSPQISGNLAFNYYERKTIASGEIARPWAMTYGLTYNYSWHKLALRASANYRDEENTEKENSPVSGEDSFTAGFGFDYPFLKIFSLFFNARIRSVYVENPSRRSYKETDMSMGVNSNAGSDWAIPLFRWDPCGVVKGVAFKDSDNDKERGADEPGIGGIKINVGRKAVVTNSKGEYSVTVRAKKVVVMIDVKSVPTGYVFSTSPRHDVEVYNGMVREVDFGMNTQSSIYGVAFYDQDFNGKPGGGERYIYGVRVILDKKTAAVTDSNGTLFFRNLAPGKHSLRIDIGSVPQEYLPTVPVVQEIELGEGTTLNFYVPLRKASD